MKLRNIFYDPRRISLILMTTPERIRDEGNALEIEISLRQKLRSREYLRLRPGCSSGEKGRYV